MIKVNPENFSTYLATFCEQQHLKKVLLTNYNSIELKDINATCYINILRIQNYIKQGELYYYQAINSPNEIKGTLYFYSLVQFMKAQIVLHNPNYPENQHVLAHGLTLKKKKKETFDLLSRNIKIQPNGLFLKYSSEVLNVSVAELDTYSLEMLYQFLPEFSHFTLLHQKNNPYLVPFSHENNYYFLDENYIRNQSISLESIISKVKREFSLELSPYSETKIGSTNVDVFPQHFFNKLYYIQHDLHSKKCLPEVLCYCLLLYALSMFSRYEADEWLDIIRDLHGLDYHLLTTFFHLCQHKLPTLIVSLLPIHLNEPFFN